MKLLDKLRAMRMGSQPPDSTSDHKRAAEGACYSLLSLGEGWQEAFAALPLETFNKSGLILKVKSRVLDGETVLFASDKALLRPNEGPVVYRVKELLRLLDADLNGEDLKGLHGLKKHFNGEIVDDE